MTDVAPVLAGSNQWKVVAWLTLLGLLALTVATDAAGPGPTLTVDAGKVLRDGADHFVGINLNYLRDSDANRPHARPLNEALRDLGARWLRYPGGEKSDFYLWSQPPYDKSSPASLGWYKTVEGTRLDFDQYIAAARAAGAEPYVVVGYDTTERTGRTREQWRDNAVAWVKYANAVKKYGVKYWEIGNENWHNNTARPADMAAIVAEFSRALKAVDSTIKVGASGNNDQWWSAFLPVAAPHLDFITLSLYNAWNWKSYDHWARQPRSDLIGDARSALAAIDHYAPAADRSRLKLIVAETNSKDYSQNGWPGTNTLGHALVTFETLGRLMQQERILSAMVWTTRWVKDAEARESQWYALGPDNEILPTGRAVALWGQFIKPKMIAVEGGTGLLSAYASCSTDGASVSIWIVNRGYDPVDGVSLALKALRPYSKAVAHRLSGTSPDDANPRWEQLAAPTVSDHAVSGLTCPGVSVTVISLE